MIYFRAEAWQPSANVVKVNVLADVEQRRAGPQGSDQFYFFESGPWPPILESNDWGPLMTLTCNCGGPPPMSRDLPICIRSKTERV